MNKFFEDVLKLPYKGNSQDNPAHENQVEELLIKHGLKYVAQPNGIQNSPDFHVYYNDTIISLECKSAAGAKPTYNSGLPKKGVIYIFSSKKYDATTIYYADDVVSDEMREAYDDLINALDKVVKVFQNNPVVKACTRGFNFYMRAMYTQAGKWTSTNYFKHEDRERCEQNVLNTEW
jgi:hypothetical protein|tara:strand:+ start:135 stop:665 length:531 start_codon:yes stop_codon:yes gene_type:complete